MKKRSKKYFSDNKSKPLDSKKDVKSLQGNPAKQVTSANQDDTGGGNDSGKRSDEN